MIGQVVLTFVPLSPTSLVYRVGQKVSCCIAGCNFLNYAPILRNSTVRKLTKFQEICI